MRTVTALTRCCMAIIPLIVPLWPTPCWCIYSLAPRFILKAFCPSNISGCCAGPLRPTCPICLLPTTCCTISRSLVRNTWMIIMETMRNRHGVTIRCCCASCQHREIRDDGTRLCQKMQLLVNPLFCCGLWDIAQERDNIRPSVT